MTYKSIGKKRLAVDIPAGLHIQLTELAYLHNITITTYVLDAISRQIAEDRHANESDKRTKRFIAQKIARKN